MLGHPHRQAGGPEIAASSGAPSTVAFCTISKLARLVTTTNPGRRVDLRAHRGADQLVERVVPAHVLAHQLQRAVGSGPSGGVHGAAGRVEGLIGGQAHRAPAASRPNRDGAVPDTGWICLSTASTPSAPQMPHPVRPVSRRVRSAMTAAHRAATVA